MRLRRDRMGFIFSLDAALAMLVVMIAIAGVARIAGPELTYGQHGYLRLGRYANDALEVTQLLGDLDNIKDSVIAGDSVSAENLARTTLRKILPDEVQFKLVVGDNRLTVYPSDDPGWDSTFSNAEEIAVGVRVSTFPPKENLRVLAWLDDPLDEAFMDELEKGTNWEVTRTSDETDFQQRILWSDPDGSLYYDTVFIPDDNTVEFDDVTKLRLLIFNNQGGNLVFGGKTLYTTAYPIEDWLDWYLMLWVGVYDWGSPPELVGEPEFNRMKISEVVSPITAFPPYTVGYEVEYSGEVYEQYVYERRNDFPGILHTLAQWDNVPTGLSVIPTPWPGILWWEAFQGWTYYYGPTTLFNVRLAQSAMDSTTDPPNAGKEDWITLARRAIGYEQVFEPITLYVWRGEAVG